MQSSLLRNSNRELRLHSCKCCQRAHARRITRVLRSRSNPEITAKGKKKEIVQKSAVWSFSMLVLYCHFEQSFHLSFHFAASTRTYGATHVSRPAAHYNTLQHTATHCNTQHARRDTRELTHENCPNPQIAGKFSPKPAV